MKYFVAAILIYYLNAHWAWWLAFALIIVAESAITIYAIYKDVVSEMQERLDTRDHKEALLKFDGSPYTYQDLQLIWNNGYENGIAVSKEAKH
jgi:hypothetical protein